MVVGTVCGDDVVNMEYLFSIREHLFSAFLQFEFVY